jgi:hypothetical protein
VFRTNLNNIYAKIEAWRNRRIEGKHPYPYVDGIVMKRSWAGEVRIVSLWVASAVNSEGFREILGICEGAKEDQSGWSAFFARTLVDCGLKGVELVISDDYRGLVCRERFGFPAAGSLPTLQGAFLPQRLQLRPFGQGSRGQPHAQGHSCPDEPGGRRQHGPSNHWRPAGKGQGSGSCRAGRPRDPDRSFSRTPFRTSART